MKRAALATVLAMAATVLWSSCGGGSGSSSGNQSNPVSKLQNRAFVTNTFSGILQIVDAQLDKLTTFSVSVGASPTTVLISKDKSTILTYSTATLSIVAVDPTTERVAGSATAAAPTESIVISDDGKFAYAAEKNATVTGQPNGAVQILALKDATSAKSPIPVAGVRWISLNHAGNVLLAFSDQSNVVTKVDPTATTPTPTTVVGSFDRPIAAFFSSDDSKAYILNCGPECGGTTASVTELTLSNGTTRNVAVSAASIGVIDGATLYVAGVPGGTGAGTIQAVDTTAMTATTAKAIAAGVKTLMVSSGNKIWVGSSNCDLPGLPNRGCLSVYNPADQSVKINDPAAGQSAKGNVTGIAPVNGRSVTYVVEGGELRVYDNSTLTDITPLPLDIVGSAYGVVTIP